MSRQSICVTTPVEDYREQFGLLVKREDLSCPPPGPPFSKTRGVFAHIVARPERVIGVLDTYHSQGGWAVAHACRVLGKTCVNYYPRYKADGNELRPQQTHSMSLGAHLRPLPAGRSAILYHQAKKELVREFGPDVYMMPNALKLPETVSETAAELLDNDTVRAVMLSTAILVPASSATIAAGVVSGLLSLRRDMLAWKGDVIIHLGYSRSEAEVLRYITQHVGSDPAALAENFGIRLDIVNEGYAYKDRARPGPDVPWPCNEYYDLKTVRWWLRQREQRTEFATQHEGRALLWNVG